MRVLVVYESMFGNTHVVAEAVAAGFGPGDETTVVPVGDAGPDLVYSSDLVIVGGPTHMHGMSRASTRKMAADTAGKEGSPLHLEPQAAGAGLRDWFATLGRGRARAAAFDTRFEGPAAFTGRASKAITRQLHRHGFEVVAEPESFLVDKQNRLLDGEAERARRWGAQLADAVKEERAAL
ncbi:MAG TPA: flavodoxin domain-containing protein [Acidimicrobiales bacterium]|nr:flavodoxin domain-containing protein [Acidimicrobiales bacterium]